MTRYEIMRIWRNVSPESIITEDGLRICEAIRNEALEEAARAADNHALAEQLARLTMANPVSHSVTLTRVIARAIRALKSTAKGAGGQG